ncbi:MAG: DUF1615 domain-containing protein [Candidatus Accumulibacter sp.]|uniref:DUF1615 domain-containing protein n=1 Tax=Accumulibacter sp. TaxID=2053492 RepID=UPI0025D63B5E|nr:DUF1615 domain-containing protein [Accumulibacter sp.]MCP5247132.1 DUF1615 domain-containing protein [Accumulibacter sp.]
MPLLLLAVIVGCATDGGYESRPSPPARPELAPAPGPPPTTTAARPPAVSLPIPLPYPSEREGPATADTLLPAGIGERAGWAADIVAAFVALRIPLTAENLCAVISIIAQESTFQADPPVPGLSRIVWQELDKRREKYAIPKVVVDVAVSKKSPDGRSYRERIDALRTEKQMNALYDAMISELPGGRTLFAGYNPVRTGGPMQVSVEFAEQQVRQRPYPYPLRDSVRDEVFSRRGGLYFGIAMLLDYPASYSQMIYRFADFNAGRYSSRNAAFQDAVGRLGGQRLTLDGDLLRYQGGVPAAATSDTQRAVLALRPRLQLSEAEIQRDLRLEKTFAFEQSLLYQRLYALADANGGARQPRERLPQIDLESPKITRRLTTEWFAKRVDSRYRSCLERRRPDGAS